MTNKLEMKLLDAGRVDLKGSLTFSTVAGGLKALRAVMVKNQPLVVDLQYLEHADSSALAMCLQLVDEAREQKVVLSFAHLPDFLLRIAKLSNAEKILPLAH